MCQALEMCPQTKSLYVVMCFRMCLTICDLCMCPALLLKPEAHKSKDEVPSILQPITLRAMWEEGLEEGVEEEGIEHVC